ncbi:MAG: hypothetical protein MPN21_03240 [Thermoanaerobaculia bacterium]|nr:hypothetical protein [Thermoanaerobaculia bacterium]
MGNDARDRKVLAAYRAGGSLRSVGEAFGISHAAIAKILDAHQEPRRRRGRPGAPGPLRVKFDPVAHAWLLLRKARGELPRLSSAIDQIIDELPDERARSAPSPDRGVETNVDLSPASRAKVERLGKAHGATLASVVRAAVADDIPPFGELERERTEPKGHGPAT